MRNHKPAYEQGRLSPSSPGAISHNSLTMTTADITIPPFHTICECDRLRCRFARAKTIRCQKTDRKNETCDQSKKLKHSATVQRSLHPFDVCQHSMAIGYIDGGRLKTMLSLTQWFTRPSISRARRCLAL